MKTCGTCKHWWKDDQDTLEFRTCKRVRHDPDGLTQAYDFEVAEGEEPTEESVYFMKENRAVVNDGSGYYAALRTRDDFGCVLHEPCPEGT